MKYEARLEFNRKVDTIRISRRIDILAFETTSLLPYSDSI